MVGWFGFVEEVREGGYAVFIGREMDRQVVR
jgi:hypothetical protein